MEPAAPASPLNPSFIVAGEALIDLIQQPDGRLVPKLGGSPWNLARALGRLGRAVRYVSPLSGDRFGRQLRQALTDCGVEVAGDLSTRPTSLALVSLDAQGQPDYAFYRDGVADRDLDPRTLLDGLVDRTSVFHVGSLALFPPDAEAWQVVLRALAVRGVTTSVDINLRPQVARDEATRRAYVEGVAGVLALARIVKVSDEDLQAIGRPGDPLVQARELLGPMTQVVVLTLGAQGAWCLTGAGEYFQEPSQVAVVDTLGAGDCFYAGFLARLDELGVWRQPGAGECDGGLSMGAPFASACVDALAFANRVVAFNLQRSGCEPPWRCEITDTASS